MNLNEPDNEIVKNFKPYSPLWLIGQTILVVYIIMQSYGSVKEDVALLKAENARLKERIENLEHTIYRYNKD